MGGAAWGDGAGGLLVELVEEVDRVILALGGALENGGVMRPAPLYLGGSSRGARRTAAAASGGGDGAGEEQPWSGGFFIFLNQFVGE